MTNQLPEAGGIAYADLMTPEGMPICVTARDETATEAVSQLLMAVEVHKLTPKRNGVPSKPMHVPPAAQAPPPPEAPPDPAWNPAPEPLAVTEAKAQTVPVIGKDWGLVDRKPNASDLNFGDRFEIQVDEYKYFGGEIKFYRTGMEYPDLTHGMKADYPKQKFAELFNNWLPDENDERHPMPGGSVIMAIQCTDAGKQTKHGNPYQNLDGMRRP